MGEELYESGGIFAHWMKYLDTFMFEKFGRSILARLYGGNKSEPFVDTLLSHPCYAAFESPSSRGTRIDVDEPLESYGLDSIMVTQLNIKLGEVFEVLPKTLFYEFRSLRELGDYLASNWATACTHWCGLNSQEEGPLPNAIGAPLDFELKESAAPLLSSRRAKCANANPRLSRVPTGGQSPQGQELIAIIGLAGRYPKADSSEAYWRILAQGLNCITEIPPARWSHAKHSDSKTSKWGGFIDGFSEFDPLFFNISPREAQNMDPQERLFLQCAYEALQDAGYTREQLVRLYQGRVA